MQILNLDGNIFNYITIFAFNFEPRKQVYHFVFISYIISRMFVGREKIIFITE
jgi:hypothetical protein